MDSIVEENGNSSNNIDDRTANILITTSNTMQEQQGLLSSSGGVVDNATTPMLAPNMPTSATASVVTSAANVAQYLPSPTHGLQSVIQAANQSSVIQSAVTNSLTKGCSPSSGVLYMNKPNTTTVIHTAAGNTVQVKHEPPANPLDSNSEDSYTDEDSPRRQKDLTRRPSYHKIFNEISGPDISVVSNLHMTENCGVPSVTSTGGGSSTAGSHIYISQDSAPAFYLPSRIPYNTNNSVLAEDQTRKREIRLQKNREAARECRRKKKEYIKCLENRVAVLENQNKALIEELKSLKELYCQTKND